MNLGAIDDGVEVKLTLVLISILASLAAEEMRESSGLAVQMMRSEGGMRLCWRMAARTREPRWPVGEVRMNLVMAFGLCSWFWRYSWCRRLRYVFVFVEDLLSEIRIYYLIEPQSSTGSRSTSMS